MKKILKIIGYSILFIIIALILLVVILGLFSASPFNRPFSKEKNICMQRGYGLNCNLTKICDEDCKNISKIIQWEGVGGISGYDLCYCGELSKYGYVENEFEIWNLKEE